MIVAGVVALRVHPLLTCGVVDGKVVLARHAINIEDRHGVGSQSHAIDLWGVRRQPMEV